MTVKLILVTTTDDHVLAHTGNPDQPLVPPAPLSALPRIEGQSNPFVINPIEPGQRLFAAMGGEALLDLLATDSDNLLLLIIDDKTAAIPWEYAVTTPDNEPLVWQYPLLRLLPTAPAPRPAPQGALNLAVLAADPLVDQNGNPIPAHRRFGPEPLPGETTPRLSLDHELAAISQTLTNCGRAVEAHRVPPTAKHLQQALRRGPAVLHLSCHGTVIAQNDGTLQPVLALEDEHGQLARLRGDTLKRLPPPGVLRLVMMSACRSATGSDANLTRALVLTGSAPAAVGMQGDFPDKSSAEFAATLYDSLLLNFDLGESLRQARIQLPKGFAGLPVAYVTRQGWLPLPVEAGRPGLTGLQADGRVNLPPALTAPSPFVESA